MSHCVKATDIVSTHVENWEGENLGNITDVVLDKRDGELLYLVLSYPGDYGRQYPNKRFAVPFESIAMRKLSNHEVEYILDVNQEFLKQSPGFEKDNWPNFADERFIRDLKEYYKDVSVNILA